MCIKYVKNVKIKNIVYFLNHIENYLSISALIIFFLAICINVFLRYFFNKPFVHGDEISRFLFVYMVFFGASNAVKNNKHIAVDYFMKTLPLSRKYKEIIEFFINILIIYFLITLIYWGFRFSYRVRFMISPSMEIPWIYIYIAIPLLAISMCIQYVEKVIKIMKEVKVNHGNGNNH